MNKKIKNSLRLTVFFVAMLFLCYSAMEGIAYARAGGGRSFGSRGFSSGRGYQRSTPMQPPRTYQQQQAQPRQVTPPQQQPSFGRGLLYGIGGGLLGGMIGGMLFGRLGYAGTGWGGGFGFGDIIILIIIMGIIYFIVKKVKTRRQMGIASAGPGYGTFAYNQEPADDISYNQVDSVSQALRHIAEMDPSFDEVRFKETAQDIFFKIQGAWTRRDLDSVRHLLTPEMLNIFQAEIDKQIANKQINRLENIAIRQVDIVDAAQDQGEEYITVRFLANLLDYTVDEKDGRIISGSDRDPVKFLEYWTFYRKIGDKQWVLSGITQEGDY
ncbi:MAG: Tim44 domain-containing protein [Syntrophorhabdaceae bacterium]|nr:Tim44 domain-containing protein [Syntrophorhabdaceae bacterium]